MVVWPWLWFMVIHQKKLGFIMIYPSMFSPTIHEEWISINWAWASMNLRGWMGQSLLLSSRLGIGNRSWSNDSPSENPPRWKNTQVNGSVWSSTRFGYFQFQLRRDVKKTHGQPTSESHVHKPLVNKQPYGQSTNHCPNDNNDVFPWYQISYDYLGQFVQTIVQLKYSNNHYHPNVN